MLSLQIGDTIEPFFYGDYWMEEEWDCEDCRQQTPQENRWQKAVIHCVNGLIVEVTSDKPSQGKLPGWALIHKISRDRQRFRQTLRGIRGAVLVFKDRPQAGEGMAHPLPDIGPKTVDELLARIVDDVNQAEREARAEVGEP